MSRLTDLQRWTKNSLLWNNIPPIERCQICNFCWTNTWENLNIFMCHINSSIPGTHILCNAHLDGNKYSTYSNWCYLQSVEQQKSFQIFTSYQNLSGFTKLILWLHEVLVRCSWKSNSMTPFSIVSKSYDENSSRILDTFSTNAGETILDVECRRRTIPKLIGSK